jgi:acyl-CoA reductase-like NAD-dependent aldehyde dehydrogenase
MLAEVNASPYGLSGSLWTNDLRRALRVASKVESGVLSVNSHSSVHVETPFGGFKQSGFGRDHGMKAMESFTELKNVYIAM